MQVHTIAGALAALKSLIEQYGGVIAAVLLVVMAIAVAGTPRGKP